MAVSLLRLRKCERECFSISRPQGTSQQGSLGFRPHTLLFHSCVCIREELAGRTSNQRSDRSEIVSPGRALEWSLGPIPLEFFPSPPSPCSLLLWLLLGQAYCSPSVSVTSSSKEKGLGFPPEDLMCLCKCTRLLPSNTKE